MGGSDKHTVRQAEYILEDSQLRSRLLLVYQLILNAFIDAADA